MKPIDAALPESIYLNSLLNTIVDAVITMNRKGFILSVNKATEVVFGYSAKELIAQKVNILMPEPFHSEHDNYIKDYLTTREKKIIGIGREVLGRHKDGSTIRIDLNVGEIDNLGEPVFIGILHKAIADDAKHYQAIINSSDDAIISKTIDGIITSWNPGAEKMFGYTAAEVIGKPMLILFPDDRKEEEYDILKRISTGEKIDHFETVRKRKDGREINISATISPILDENGKIIGASKIARDITELKSMYQQVIQSQKMESIGRLAGGIAHDFNNMLGGILGNLELFKNAAEKKLNQQEMGYILSAEKSGLRSTELVKQLLGFARKGKYELVALNINEILLEARNLLYRTIDKSIIVKAVMAPELWVIEGDPTQLLQVIMNVGLNARDAMPRGGELLLECNNLTADEMYCRHNPQLTPGEYVCITISDTGVGMNSNQLERIFEPFYTSKSVGEGTGLGLSMADGIIKNHGGVISVYSELDKGTVFHVYLPRLNAKHNRHIATVDPKPIEKSSNTLAGRVVLVVDDEEVIRNIAKTILESQSIHVKLAFNGEEAIAYYKIHVNEIDIVVLDIVMPIMDGTRVFLELKKINPDVKVIFSSGYTESDKISNIRQTEENVQFIQKPFSQNQFISLVHKCLEV